MTWAIDIDHLCGWIGREETSTDTLTAGLVDRYVATLGLPRLGTIAPRLIHFCLCLPAVPTSALGEDGHPARGCFLPPVPLPRRMWAASDIRFVGDFQVGETVIRQSRVVDVVLKQGRGGALCFVIIDHGFHVGGTLRVADRQTLVYRAAAEAGHKSGVGPSALRGAVVETVAIATTLLFRYSALTFNGHRIHYDQSYARDVEEYDGLVVHGPLQAALLMDLASRARGRAPDRLTFRGRSPLLHTRPVGLHADVDAAGTATLWTAHPGGPVALQAEAHWL